MDRRAFLGTLGLLAAARAGEAQQAAKAFRVGYLASASAITEKVAVEAFREELQRQGWVDGVNLVMTYRFADGDAARLGALAQELVGANLHVLVTRATPATHAAQRLAGPLPIVMIGVGDPVGSGFVRSLARPGGNITGTSFVGPELAAKNLELLKEVAPRSSRVAVLVNPTNPLDPPVARALGSAADALRVTLQRVEVRDGEGFSAALNALKDSPPDAVLTLNDPVFLLRRAQLVELCARLRIPTMFQQPLYVQSGGLMSFQPSVADMSRRAAVQVSRIFRGANPSDLPVEQPTKFELVINLHTAKALGLTIPPSVLLRADEVIQ